MSAVAGEYPALSTNTVSAPRIGADTAAQVPPSPQAHREWVLAAVEQYEAALVVYAARLLNDLDLARDAVQETYFQLCRQNPADLEGRLSEWLFRVCRSRALDLRRKEKHMSPLTVEPAEPQSNAPAPLDVCELKESSSAMLRLLKLLPANQQEVIRLKFQHGLSYKEISRVTSLSAGNVGFLIHTGLKTLRTQLEAQKLAL